MHDLMAAARKAGDFVGFDVREKRGISGMHSAFFEGTRSGVAVKTLAIVVRLVELDISGPGRMTEVIHVDVTEAADFRLNGAEHCVVGMAGITGFVGGNTVIQVVGGGKVKGVAHVKAFAIRLHDVAGETELGALGAVHLGGEAHTDGEKRKREESKEGNDIADRRRGDLWTKHKHSDQRDAKGDEEQDEEGCKIHQGTRLESGNVFRLLNLICRAFGYTQQAL